MSEFVSTHIIEFALAQSDGRVRFIVLTATVDRRAFKQLSHTHAHAHAHARTHTHTHARARLLLRHAWRFWFFEIGENKNYNFFRIWRRVVRYRSFWKTLTILLPRVRWQLVSRQSLHPFATINSVTSYKILFFKIYIFFFFPSKA